MANERELLDIRLVCAQGVLLRMQYVHVCSHHGESAIQWSYLFVTVIDR